MKKILYVESNAISMTVMSRDDAKKKGLKRYFTAEACANGHFCERYTASSHCIVCSRIQVAKTYAMKKLPHEDQVKLNEAKHFSKLQKRQCMTGSIAPAVQGYEIDVNMFKICGHSLFRFNNIQNNKRLQHLKGYGNMSTWNGSLYA